VAGSTSSSGNHSPKRDDLLRDARYALHSFPSPNVDEEFYVAGRATRVDAAAARKIVNDAYTATGATTSNDTLFELWLERALHAKSKERPSWPPLYTKRSADRAARALRLMQRKCRVGPARFVQGANLGAGDAMEFVLLFTQPKGAPAPDPASLAAGRAEMRKLARELSDKKILKCGAPLAHDAVAATVRVRGAKPLVIDGPFAESKELIAGSWVIEVADREEAIEIAKRCPHARHAPVLVSRFLYRGAFDDAENGTPFLLLFRMEPGLTDADGAKGREMRAFGETLLPAKTLIETGRLADDQEAPARVEVRHGKPLITDGPFAESKEVIGGYGIVRVASRVEAIALAARFPHARWSPVEVREILFFDRV
jgi:hypothetical protein